MTDHLKLFTDDTSTATLPAPSEPTSLRRVQAAFTLATGWDLRTELVDDFDRLPGPAGEASAQRVRLVASAEAERLAIPRVERGRALELGDAIQTLASELRSARRAVRRREAELAAGVPVATHRDQREHLSARLTAILREAAAVLGLRSAAVYMLNGDTMHLKLRASWRLPHARLLAPARALDACPADVEALSDVAVTIESAEQAAAWRAPEACGAAICVRIISSTVPLGTLWFFGRKPRRIGARQQALARVVAGRIAAELEREVLLAETQALATLRSQMHEASSIARGDSRPAPCLEDWTLAGWTRYEASLGAAFHAWHAPRDTGAWLAIGECNGRRLTGAMRSAALGASLQALWRHTDSPSMLLAHANAQLFQREAGDAVATVAAARLNGGDEVRLSVAGDPCVLLVTESGAKELVEIESPLGLSGRLRPRERPIQVPRGAAVVLATSGVRDALDARGKLFGPRGIVRALRKAWSTKAQVLADALREHLETHTGDHTIADAAVVVACRR